VRERERERERERIGIGSQVRAQGLLDYNKVVTARD
jgi:hypothetical protein